jgi:hypothetical protein
VPRYLALMRRMGRLAVVTGLLGLALAGCHAASAASPAATASPRLSVPGTHKSTTVYRISSPIGTLVVTSHVGDITVTGGGTATLVTQQVAYSSTPPMTSRTVDGKTLTVTYTCRAQVVCGVAYVIQVPRDVAVRATAGAGAIRLTGLAGSVTAKADVGYITGTSLAGGRVSLTTDVGGISAAFAAAPAAVAARTRIGAVTVRVPGSASYRVSVHDHLGKVTVTVRQSASATHAITATTDVGAILIAPVA